MAATTLKESIKARKKGWEVMIFKISEKPFYSAHSPKIIWTRHFCLLPETEQATGDVIWLETIWKRERYWGTANWLISDRVVDYFYEKVPNGPFYKDAEGYGFEIKQESK